MTSHALSVEMTFLDSTGTLHDISHPLWAPENLGYVDRMMFAAYLRAMARALDDA